MLALLLLGASACLLGRIFTPCRANWTRSVFFYWQDACDLVPPPPLSDLSCGAQCPAGFFLNAGSEGIMCAQCPANTYHQGDYLLLTARDLATSCRTSDAHWKDCSGWKGEGSWMHSGDSLHFGLAVKSSLRFYTFLDRVGSLSLRYSKLTRKLEGRPNGVLRVLVNSLSVLLDDSFTTPWQNFSIPLQAGPNLLELEFEKYTAAGQEDVAVRVESWQMHGSTPGLDCSPCLQGFSRPGAAFCSLCPADYYLLNATCEPCPSHYFAPSGNSATCQLRLPCVDADFLIIEGPCESGKQTRKSILSESATCELVNLPPAHEHPCDMCAPGQYHSGLECRACSPGSALTETAWGQVCSECSAGFYAAQVLNFSNWISVSAPFATLSFDQCAVWQPRGLYLSQRGLCDTWLFLAVNVLESSATFLCKLSLTGPTSVDVEIDGVLHQLLSESEDLIVSAALELGRHEIRWHYKGAPESEARLHWVAVKGLGLGGAPECLPCPQGYFSPANSSACLPCPPGSTHTVFHEACELCPQLSYNSISGSMCMPCPEFTVPSEDHSKCMIGLHMLQVSNRTFEIGSLAEGKEICDSRPCLGHLYGPVESNEGSFYLSVLNPDTLDSEEWAFAWGVLQGSMSSLKTVNLGRQAQVETIDKGFVVKYTEGSPCSESFHYASTVNFTCSSAEGWPTLVSASQCEFKFHWETRSACALCQSPTIVRSVCKDGVRMAMLKSDCMGLPAHWEEPCTVLWELMGSWVGEAMILTILLLIGLILAQCLQLQQLKRERKTVETRGIELT